METRSEYLPGGTRVLTTEAHRFGSDALLLAGFCGAKPAWAVADLCAGCGIVFWALWDAGLRGPGLAVELDGEAAALVEEAARLNGAAQLTVMQADLRLLGNQPRYDLVTANPPYFSEGPRPQSPARARARHEVSCTLDELCRAAAGLLKDRGRFCLCYPPARLAQLFAALDANRLAPKRMQLVRKNHQTAPWLALVDARKNGGAGLQVLPDRILPPGAPVHY